MPYFLVTIGLLLIIYVLKFNGKSIKENLDTNNNKEENKQTFYSFDEFFKIQESILELKNEIQDLKEEIIYINENYVALDLRINELENKKENDKVEVEDKENNKKDEENKINSLNDKIKDMYDKGISVEEISAALRIGKGEVLLRLGLNKQRKR